MLSAVFTNAAGVILKVIRLSNEEYPTFVLDYSASIPEGATHLYTSVFTEFIDDEMEIWLTNSENPADWEPNWQEHKETWIAAVPLHWQVGESLPELTIGENKKLGRQDEMKYKLIQVHRFYDYVSYEEYKDLRNLIWAHNGNFNLRDVYGWGEGTQEYANSFGSFYSFPDAGMRGTTARNTNGRTSFNPGLLREDKSHNLTFSTCSCPSIFGYIWLPARVILSLSTFSRNGEFCSFSKNDAIRSAVTMRRKNAGLGDGYTKLLWVREWRHFNGRERRIHPLTKYERVSDSGTPNTLQVIGGRYLDILQRRDGGNVNMGCAINNDVGGRSDDELYATDHIGYGTYSDGGMITKWDWRRQFIVPIFRGKVIKASSPEELRKLKHYKFLLDERPDLSKW